jgi:hypothetical protein
MYEPGISQLIETIAMYYARNREGMHEPREVFLLPPSSNMRHRIVLAFPYHSQFH